MSQERIQSTENRAQEAQLPISTPQIAKPQVKTEKARIIHGPNEQYAPVGKTVGQVRKALRDILHISTDAKALIGVEEVSDDYVLLAGDQLEFSKESGVKGSLVIEPSRFAIRWFLACDWEEIYRIERECSRLGKANAWTETDFSKALSDSNTIGLLLEQQEHVLGFVVYNIVTESVLYILNFAIDPRYLNQGVEEAIMDKLKSKLGRVKKVIQIHVPESNLDMQLLLKKQNFIATEISDVFRPELDEDAYLMEFFG